MHPYIHWSESLDIPTYFLVISLCLCLGLIWLWRRSEIYDLPHRQVLDLSFLVMAASLVGARLFHIFYEAPDYYRQNPIKVFFLWQGGFVFYGGAILATGTAWLYLRWARIENPGGYFDVFAPVLALCYGLGRIGCFFAGCCFGKVCDLPWAVGGRHPTQLYATIWETGVVLILLGLEGQSMKDRPRRLRHAGDLFLVWVFFHGLGRIFMESLRDDDRGPLIFNLSISMLLSIVFSGAALVWWLRRQQASSPARIS